MRFPGGSPIRSRRLSSAVRRRIHRSGRANNYRATAVDQKNGRRRKVLVPRQRNRKFFAATRGRLEHSGAVDVVNIPVADLARPPPAGDHAWRRRNLRLRCRGTKAFRRRHFF